MRWLLVVAALAGCRVDTSTPPVAPVEPPSEPAAAAPPAAPSVAPTPPPAGAIVQAPLPPNTVDLAPQDGPLGEQLARHAAKAKALGLVPFAQVYGDWCASCRKLRAATADPRVLAAFGGTYVVRVDTARWGSELQQGLWLPEGYKVPAFHVLRDDGTFGAVLTGDAWGEDLPENIAPKLDGFFRTWGAKR